MKMYQYILEHYKIDVKDDGRHKSTFKRALEMSCLEWGNAGLERREAGGAD